MFDFSIVTSWVHELLTSFMPLGLAIFIECVIVGLCILLMYVVVAILMIFMERKVCAAFQCRLGPMRVGPWGTLQVFADVFKMLTKEIITIRRSDKFLYNLAPYIVILASVLAFSCLPFNKGMEILDFNVGVFFMMAASSIGIVIYLIAGNAEVNRGPFDLPEAESELTAGYHTEYSGMHFGLFYVAEFVNLFIIAGVASTIFLGGWMPLHISGWEGFNTVMDYIPGFVWFFGKTLFVIWLLMWIKWTFPRLRVDQILTLEWKYLVPIGLVNLLLMVVIVVFKLHF